MTADIGGLSSANQPDNQLIQQQRAQETQERVRDQQLAAQREQDSSRAEQADKATISTEAANAAQQVREVPVRETEADNLQAVENNLDYARESVNKLREMARAEREQTSSVSDVAKKQQEVDTTLNDVSATEQAINRRLEKQAQESDGANGYEFQRQEQMGRIAIELKDDNASSDFSLSDMYSGGAASLQNNPQAAEDITTKVLEDMSELQVGVDNVRSGLYSNIKPGSISALEGSFGNAETAQQALSSVVGNLMTNNGALLESVSGNISGERVFDLLSGN